MSGFNIFDKFDFITWVSQDFLEHYGLFTYEDALTQFENLHSVEASFAICWQQLDSLFFCMDEDQLRTIREEVLRDLESSNSWKGNFPNQFRAEALRELWNQIEFETNEYGHSDRDSHHNQIDYEVIEEVFEEDARQRRVEHLDRLSALVRLAKPNTDPDEYIVDKDAIIYVHLSVGLALLLEEVEGGYSERHWELLESALRVIRAPKTELFLSWTQGNEVSSILEKSITFLEVLIECKLFQRDFQDSEFMQALERLNRAFGLALFETNSAFGEEAFDVFTWIQEQPSPYPLLNAEVDPLNRTGG